jgi:hypothetical protein
MTLSILPPHRVASAYPRRPRGGSRPSWPVLVACAAAVLFGLSIAITPAAGRSHLDPLPPAGLPGLAATALAYRACVRWIKPG